MPELPEIETIKLQLEEVLVGERLMRVMVSNSGTVVGNYKLIENKKIVGIRRRAKVLMMDFEGGMTMAFHFKMTGQLVYIPHPNPSPKLGEGNSKGEVLHRIVGGHPTEDFVGKLPSLHTRVNFKFEKGTLYFNDQRLFGWVKVGPTREIDKLTFLEKLGPEALEIAEEEFVRRVSKFKRPIKVVLMDQEVLAGVGNIYANDALWEAKINPQTPSHKLQKEELGILLEKVKLVLREGIKYGGATADNYVNLHGVGGHYQEHFRTYNRAGLPCHRCGTKIKKIVMGGRGTYYCPVCQKES